MLVIFDLDGTLINTSEGILNSYNHVINKYNLKNYSNDELKSFIGMNLFNVFKIQFGLNDIQAKEVMGEYRSYYKKQGYKEARVYDLIKTSLEGLVFEGAKIAVATLKLESLAKQQLNYFGLDKYIDLIKGMDESESLSKLDLIKICMDELNESNAIMVGDTDNDRFGALKIGIPYISVKSERR
jgi:phosphoglycolate phosphatase